MDSCFRPIKALGRPVHNKFIEAGRRNDALFKMLLDDLEASLLQ